MRCRTQLRPSLIIHFSKAPLIFIELSVNTLSIISNCIWRILSLICDKKVAMLNLKLNGVYLTSSRLRKFVIHMNQ
jgi:hypothetical protein